MKKFMDFFFIGLVLASLVSPQAMAFGELGLDHKLNRFNQELVLDDNGRVPCSNGQCELAPMPEPAREPDPDDLMEDFWGDFDDRLERRDRFRD